MFSTEAVVKLHSGYPLRLSTILQLAKFQPNIPRLMHITRLYEIKKKNPKTKVKSKTDLSVLKIWGLPKGF